MPESVLDKSSPAYNKGRICAHGASPAVVEAFAAASRRGLRRFFECRAEEIAPGGVLAFYVPGRDDHAHPEIQYSEDTVSVVPPIERAWTELENEVKRRHSCFTRIKSSCKNHSTSPSMYYCSAKRFKLCYAGCHSGGVAGLLQHRIVLSKRGRDSRGCDLRIPHSETGIPFRLQPLPQQRRPDNVPRRGHVC